MDVCRWIPGATGYFERLLEICLPLYRLPGLRFPRHDGKAYTLNPNHADGLHLTLSQVNEFAHRNYDCAVEPGSSAGSGKYYCMYPSDLESEGRIRGTAVLEAYHYSTNRTGEWIGILIAIIAAYRIFGYAVLWLKKH